MRTGCPFVIDFDKVLQAMTFDSVNSSSRIVILVTDQQLEPLTRGHRVRIVGLLKTLTWLGYQTLLLAPPQHHASLVAAFIWRHCVVDCEPYPGGRLTRFSSEAMAAALERAVDQYEPIAVIAEYLWLAPCLAKLPKAVIRILDAHDVMHERTQRFAEVGLDPWVHCSPDEEVEFLRGLDVILAIQPREAETFRRMQEQATVVCLPPIVHPFPAQTAYAGSERALIAVGSDHAGNYGFVHFVQEVWPRLSERFPDAHLHIAGSICGKLQPMRQCTLAGEVPSLEAFYRTSTIVVCPVDVGTGLKMKVVEALAHARPVAGTRAAFEGLVNARQPAWALSEDRSGLLDVCAELMANEDRRRAMAEHAYRYAREYFSVEAAGRTLASVLSRTSAPDPTGPQGDAA